MCIITRQGVHASPKRQRDNRGFTLPELLISLVICALLLHSAGQWSVLSSQSHVRSAENRQAVLIAQSVLAGIEPELPEGWSVQKETRPAGLFLTEQELTITHANQTNTQSWTFYYAGEETSAE